MTPPPARTILVIRPSALGDVARTVPVLASLRMAYPHARIDWVVRDIFAPVLRHHPALSNIVPFPRNEVSRWLKRLQWSKVRGYARVLRDPGYDIVFDCQGLARSGIMAWMTRAPVRVGYSDARELGWLPLTHRVRTSPRLHTVDKALTLLECLGIPIRSDPVACRLYSGPEERAWLTRETYSDRRYAVLAPTSAWAAKQWPAERFAELASWLAGQGVPAVIVGAPHEREQCMPLVNLAKRNPLVIDRIGATTIGQLMALIEGSSLVVANDSASLHIGVGFHRPLIALLGPTDPGLACPYGRAQDVIQHVQAGDEFYFRDDRSAAMMSRITTDEVKERARALLR
ncbi:MAG: glycosyltransferase family 9 protein [Phycisphaerales bacterium]